MRRVSADSRTIGERIKDRRELAGLSMRRAAGMAGIHVSTWSRVERNGSDNRFVLGRIAGALRCPVSELTGITLGPTDRDAVPRAVAVEAAVQALIGCDLEFPAYAPAPPTPVLNEQAGLIFDLRRRCDYLGAANRIAEVAPGLHAAALEADRQRAEFATRMLVMVSDAAAFTARYSGQPSAAALIADTIGRQAAERLGNPVMLGFNSFTRAHAAMACGAYQRGRLIAQRAADAVRPHMNAYGGTEVYGQLRLTSAFAAYALGEHDVALSEVAEAAEIAERTGDNQILGLHFGRENTKFWQISMHADGPDPGRAVAIARDTTPQIVQSTSRQTAFYLDSARAMTRIGKREHALRLIVTAERMAPQRVRSDRLAAETVRQLLEHARRDAAGVELRGLCERMGIDA